MIARRVLWWLAGWRPLRVIGGETEHNRSETAPLFERYFLCEIPRFVPRFGGGAVYLHHYLRSDPDRGVHDHPWDVAFAWQLAGGYVEERLAGVGRAGLRKRYVARPPGRGYFLRGEDFHRVLVPPGRPTSWSLFMHGPYRKGWGFLEDTSSLDLTLAGDVAADSRLLEFRPFRNDNDGSSKWWRDRRRHPPGRAQRRAGAAGLVGRAE